MNRLIADDLEIFKKSLRAIYVLAAIGKGKYYMRLFLLEGIEHGCSNRRVEEEEDHDDGCDDSALLHVTAKFFTLYSFDDYR